MAFSFVAVMLYILLTWAEWCMVLYTTELFVQYIFQRLLQFAANIVTLKPVLQLMFTQCCLVVELGLFPPVYSKIIYVTYKVMMSQLYYL